NRRNEPGMSLKTKEQDKKSRGGVAHSPILIQRLPLGPVYKPQTPTAPVCATKAKERTGNIYENKGTRQKVEERRSALPGFDSAASSRARAQAADPSSGVCATKMRERTGNVFENKEQGKKLKAEGLMKRGCLLLSFFF